MKLLLSLFLLLTIQLQAQVWFATNATVRTMNVVGVDAPVSLNTLLQGLVASYSFSPVNYDFTNDASVYNFHLTNAAEVYYGSTNQGLIGGGVYLQSAAFTGGYENGTNLAGLITNNSLSISFWCKFNEAPTKDYNFLGGLNDRDLIHGFTFYTPVSSGLLRGYYTDSSMHDFTIGTVDNWTTWNHFLMTIDGTNVVSYINGVPAVTNALSGGLTIHSDNKIYVGCHYSIYEDPKTLDEFNIWNRALTTNEIATLYNKGLGNTYPFTNSASPLVEGLLAGWKLEELDFAAAYSVNDKVTLVNYNTGIYSTNGFIGRGLHVSVDGFIRIADGSYFNAITTNFTVSCWAKFDSVPGANGRTLIDRSGNNVESFVLLWSGDINKLAFGVSSDGWTQGPTVQGFTPDLNRWYNVVGKHDGANLSIYVDGQFIASTNCTTSIYQSAKPFNLGSLSYSPYNMDGVIDDAYVWNRALSTNEIYEVYTNGLAGRGYPWDVSIPLTNLWINQTVVNDWYSFGEGNWQSIEVTNSKVINKIELYVKCDADPQEVIIDIRTASQGGGVSLGIGTNTVHAGGDQWVAVNMPNVLVTNTAYITVSSTAYGRVYSSTTDTYKGTDYSQGTSTGPNVTWDLSMKVYTR